MEIFDFTKCKLSGKYYGGSEKKLGIIFNNEFYMLKFQKKTPFGCRYNNISEYIGSHVYQMLGLAAQETLLGVFNGEHVVACKDFLVDGYQFVPFNDIGESTIDENRDKFQYTYDDIMKLLKANKKLTKVKETISTFFEIYIIDALLGDFDRHGGNWGFLKKDNKYFLSPIFDNGSCLFPNMINEDEMKMVINDLEKINNRVYKFPTSQIKINNDKSSYFEVISSLKFKAINEALIKIYPLIDLKKIFALIEELDIISDIHKQFYKTMIQNRYDKIIKYSYEKLVGEKK